MNKQEVIRKAQRINKSGHTTVVWPDTKGAKVPGGKGQKSWKNNSATDRDIANGIKNGDPIAVLPTSLGAVVVDIDIENPAGVIEMEDEIIASLGPPVFSYETPSGGAHLWYKTNAKEVGSSVWKYGGETGGEIRGSENYAVMWDIDRVHDWLDELQFAKCVDLTKWPFAVKVEKYHGGARSNAGRKPSPERAVQILEAIPVKYLDEYESWFRIGAAMYHEGLPFEMFLELSAKSDKWEIGECEKKWDSYAGYEGSKCGWGTLRYFSDFNPEEKPKKEKPVVVTEKIEWPVPTTKGEPTKNASQNVLKAFELLEIMPEVAWDDFRQRLMWKGNLIEDYEAAQIRQVIQSEFGWVPTKDAMTEGIVLAAKHNTVHEVKEWHESLEWDRVKRLPTLATDYFGTERHFYPNDILQTMVKGMVARVWNPGCQFDYMPILRGPQGCGKTTALLLLSNGWFAKLPALSTNNFEEKAFDNSIGKLLMECAELAGLPGSDIEFIKGWVTERFETRRIPYAQYATTRGRSYIAPATTNKSMFLKDNDNRRFPVIECGTIKLKELEEIIPQIHAEAIWTFENVHKVNLKDISHIQLSDASQKHQYEVADQYRVISPFEEWWIVSNTRQLDRFSTETLEGEYGKELPYGWWEQVKLDSFEKTRFREGPKKLWGWQLKGEIRDFSVI